MVLDQIQNVNDIKNLTEEEKTRLSGMSDISRIRTRFLPDERMGLNIFASMVE